MLKGAAAGQDGRNCRAGIPELHGDFPAKRQLLEQKLIPLQKLPAQCIDENKNIQLIFHKVLCIKKKLGWNDNHNLKKCLLQPDKPIRSMSIAKIHFKKMLWKRNKFPFFSAACHRNRKIYFAASAIQFFSQGNFLFQVARNFPANILFCQGACVVIQISKKDKGLLQWR